MERDALLLYLQNIRDLEVAKVRLQHILSSKKNALDAKLNDYPIVADYKSEPLKAERLRGFDDTLARIIMVAGAVILFASLLPGTPTEGFLIVLGLGALAFGAYHEFNNHLTDQRHREINEKRLEEQQQWNQAQDEMVQKNLAVHHEIREKYQTAIAPYEADLDKVEDLLLSFYNMNIVPTEYRNFAAICYIYDYMSSSQASLAEALLHEKLENGIQRLEGRLNAILDYLDDVLYETRCIRAENQAAVEQLISQNSQMLKKMEKAAQSTADAAEYARLASNYAHANAYFSLATYLKQ